MQMGVGEFQLKVQVPALLVLVGLLFLVGAALVATALRRAEMVVAAVAVAVAEATPDQVATEVPVLFVFLNIVNIK
jgi:hypothetical protein